MKILVLTNLYPPHYVGGYELICQSIVQALRVRGHQVEVLTSDHGLNHETSSAVTENGTFRRLKIHGMFGHPWLGIQQLYSQEKHNNQTLVSVIQRLKPDLVYVWNLGGLSKSMLFTLQASGLPTAFVVCDHWIARSERADVWLKWWNSSDGSLKQRALRQIWSVVGVRDRCHRTAPTNPITQYKFQRIYFCSKALRQLTVDAGFDVGHGAVIYCPVDAKRYHGKPPSAHRPLQRLLYAGRLTQDKGVATAIRAMGLIRDKFAGRLNIYGKGEPDYEKQLRKIVADEKLPVTFQGGATPEDMPGIYSEHDALLFTSEWAEPFALAPLEAMASGLPVIGTMTGGSGELFRHGENALTYNAGNADELAQRILELDKDPALRERLARVGYDEVRARFDEPIIVGQIEDYLKETVAVWKPQPMLMVEA